MTRLRQQVLKYVTDRPGSIVFKNDIMADLDLKSQQVTMTMLALQRSTPVGADIETVVTGNAWCYKPKSSTETGGGSASVSMAANGVAHYNLTRPLTTLIREHFLRNPNRIIHVDELVQLTGRTAQQVRVGYNNVRINSPHLRHLIKPVVRGHSWIYEPSPGASAPSSPTRPATVPAAVDSTSTVTTDSDDGDEPTDARLFEEIGRTLDGKIIIQDNDGELYHATKLRRDQEGT